MNIHQRVKPDGRAVVLSFSDASIDETYGELFCMPLRRDMGAVERASHVTDYDGFRIEIVPITGIDGTGTSTSTSTLALQLLQQSAEYRRTQLTTALACLTETV